MANSMPSNPTSVIIQGQLVLHQTGTLKKNKERYGILVAASKTGVARLEIYDDMKHSSSLMPKFMILASDIVKVARINSENKNMKNAFLISTRCDHYIFYVENPFNCDDWVRRIGETLPISCQDEKVIYEVNDLYESPENFSSQISGYLVQVDEKTRAMLGVDGEVKLVVENESISIISPSGKMVVRWGIKSIRKFSCSNKEFFLEAGRESSIGEGKFVFLTDKGETILATINKKKTIMKQKMKESSHASPGSQAVIKYQPASLPSVPVSSWDSSLIYDTLEDVKQTSSVISKQSHAGKICSQRKLPAKKDSQANKGNKSSDVNQHSTDMARNIEHQNKPQQAEIYSEPQTITNAWQEYGCDDNEDGAIYSNLNYSQQQKIESHYWQGTAVRPTVHTEQKKEVIQVEDLYAQVDFTKKSKKDK